MTDKALDLLATTACNHETSISEMRRVALVAIGELSMLRKEHAEFREQIAGSNEISSMRDRKERGK